MTSKKQSNVYEFIRHYILKHGFSPSMSEIAKGIGIQSKGVVHRYVHALVEKGFLSIEPNQHRNIRLSDHMPNPYSVPLLGRIAAGEPIEAIENQEVVQFADLFFGPDRYALQVSGDSMIEEGIHNGDIVICKHSDSAKNGDIVVALIDNESATLKKIKYQKNIIKLIPANASMETQVYESNRVQVQGVLVGLCRFNGTTY